MKWSFTFIRLMISILLITILWNGCAQSKDKKEYKGKLPAGALTLNSIDLLVPTPNDEKLSLLIPTPSVDSDVLGLRFQPELDPNIYLTWSHQMNKDSFAELGWSVNYFKAITIKFNKVFSLTHLTTKALPKRMK